MVAAQRRDRVDGAVLNESALVIRYFGDQVMIACCCLIGDRISTIVPAPEPLLAPVPDAFGGFTGRATIPIMVVSVLSIRAVNTDGVFPVKARRPCRRYRWSVNSVASRDSSAHWSFSPMGVHTKNRRLLRQNILSAQRLF